ncbi:helicase associated domain-containing protein [Curtobacterium citreum]
MTITRKRDIGGAPNDTRFGEHARAGDTITLNLSASLANQRFEAGFERVAAYVEAHGTASVPQMYVEPDGYKTGQFVATLRQRDARGEHIDPSRRQRLQALPGWVWNTKEAKYKAALEHLRQYVAKTGSATPPKGFRTDAGFRLGEWVGDQREAFLGNERRKMTPERKAELEALPGWVWTAKESPVTPAFAPKRDPFERGLELMRAYITEHGNADVPTGYNRPSDVFNLGIWAKNQRAATKPGSKRTMTAAHRAALEALPGWAESLRWKKTRDQV